LRPGNGAEDEKDGEREVRGKSPAAPPGEEAISPSRDEDRERIAHDAPIRGGYPNQPNRRKQESGSHRGEHGPTAGTRSGPLGEVPA